MPFELGPQGLTGSTVALGMLVFVSTLMAFIAVGRGGMAVLSGSAIVAGHTLDPLVCPLFVLKEVAFFMAPLDSYLWRPDEKDASYSTIEIFIASGASGIFPSCPSRGIFFSWGVGLGCWHMLPGHSLVPVLADQRQPAGAGGVGHAALDGVRNTGLMLLK